MGQEIGKIQVGGEKDSFLTTGIIKNVKIREPIKPLFVKMDGVMALALEKRHGQW